MTIFYLIIKNTILILFPILLYFVTIAYNRTVNREDNDILLEISLFTSLYLLISFGSGLTNKMPLYLLNIPLLVSYSKERKGVSVVLSFILILYLFYTFNYNIILLLIDYILCFVIFKYNHKTINTILFFIIKFIVITILTNKNIIFNLYELLLSLIIYLLVINVVEYVDNIMNYYMTLKDLEHEKQLRTSLFKISHEIKNPLAVCKGYLDLMDGSVEKYSEYTPIIKDEIDHALLILQDFSSIGKLKVSFEILDINELLDEVIDSLKPMLEENNINTMFYVDDEVFISGDYLRLKQVFINIIKNSMEALDGRKNKYIKINEHIDGDKVIISVIDNGCGISKTNIKTICTPFFTTKSRGTGLGTYLSKEIINAHKGSMEYISDEGVGTTVDIKLNIEEI